MDQDQKVAAGLQLGVGYIRDWKKVSDPVCVPKMFRNDPPLLRP